MCVVSSWVGNCLEMNIFVCKHFYLLVFYRCSLRRHRVKSWSFKKSECSVRQKYLDSEETKRRGPWSLRVLALYNFSSFFHKITRAKSIKTSVSEHTKLYYLWKFEDFNKENTNITSPEKPVIEELIIQGCSLSSVSFPHLKKSLI